MSGFASPRIMAVTADRKWKSFIMCDNIIHIIMRRALFPYRKSFLLYLRQRLSWGFLALIKVLRSFSFFASQKFFFGETFVRRISDYLTDWTAIMRWNFRVGMLLRSVGWFSNIYSLSLRGSENDLTLMSEIFHVKMSFPACRQLLFLKCLLFMMMARGHRYQNVSWT